MNTTILKTKWFIRISCRVNSCINRCVLRDNDVVQTSITFYIQWPLSFDFSFIVHGFSKAQGLCKLNRQHFALNASIEYFWIYAKD